MNSKVKTTVDKVQNRYSNIDTLLLFGSAQDHDWAPDSDIDIFAIDDTLKMGRKGIEIDGVLIEVQFDNFKNLRSDIANERGKLLNRNLSTMIANSTIISTNSPKAVKELQEFSQSVLLSPTEYNNDDVEMWRYSIRDYLGKAAKDLARDDAVAFYLDGNYAIQNALELTLATHGAYLPQPKHLAKVLERHSPKLLNILQRYPRESDLKNKMNILDELAKL